MNPPPTVNNNPAIVDLVIDDLKKRKQLGVDRYGTYLQAHNGRDAMLDLYEELMDSVIYLKQIMEERE